MGQSGFEKISEKAISASDLASEIEKLGAVTEPPSFWIGIANDRTYADAHRALSVCQLFKRHVNKAVTLGHLAVLLDHPDWIDDRSVLAIAHLKGEIPVAWRPGETVLAVRLFPRARDSSPVLYLRLAAPVDAASFVRIMRGAKADAAADNADATIQVLQAVCG